MHGAVTTVIMRQWQYIPNTEEDLLHADLLSVCSADFIGEYGSISCVLSSGQGGKFFTQEIKWPHLDFDTVGG